MHLLCTEGLTQGRRRFFPPLTLHSHSNPSAHKPLHSADLPCSLLPRCAFPGLVLCYSQSPAAYGAGGDVCCVLTQTWWSTSPSLPVPLSCRYHNVGILVLFLHDINDVQLEFTKLNVYFKHRGGVYHRLNDIISNIGCLTFSVSW